VNLKEIVLRTQIFVNVICIFCVGFTIFASIAAMADKDKKHEVKNPPANEGVQKDVKENAEKEVKDLQKEKDQQALLAKQSQEHQESQDLLQKEMKKVEEDKQTQEAEWQKFLKAVREEIYKSVLSLSAALPFLCLAMCVETQSARLQTLWCIHRSRMIRAKELSMPN